ncbi:alpha/beta hydrolase [Pseudoponticoccus marisrubri]|uniref:Esterase n=1 Tax=Pseudoponticoccus marisrubri TaxID=1685382 RepID=A0A0W7WPR2_9RHOB|nr:alpha/beta hydrolase [Pseudoponticoccus marisrubri]KUF12595.1 esterase [Pseudoponticoccus marisrubri]
MSLTRRILNLWLRWTEKPMLARAQDPLALRRAFDRKAGLLFRAPRGMAFRRAPIGGVPATHLSGPTGAPVLLYLHGGAFIMGSARTHRALAARIATGAGLALCLPEYRLAPEHPFPAAPEDALAVFDALVAQGHRVVLGGDSAGGGLALSVLAEILRRGGPAPLGAFAFSPLTDLGFSGASVRDNAGSDVLLPVSRIHDIVDLYLPGQDPADPRASPLFADFNGAPPVWLTASDTEFLLDDTRRMAARLRAAGVDVTERIARDLPHAWPLFHGFLPEARQTLKALDGWLNSLSSSSAGN